MTTTPPAPAAPRARTPRRLARTAMAVAAVLALLVPSPALAAGARSADESDPSPTTLFFQVAAEGDGVADDGTLRVALSVVNQTADTVAAADVALSVSRRPLGSRTAVDAWLDGTGSPRLRTAGAASLSTVPSLSSTSTTVELDTDDDLRPGVYALLATYESSRGPVESRSVWVVADEDADRGDVAVVVPITAGPLTTGLLSIEQLETLTAPGGDLRVQLDAVRGTRAILAVDPAIVASIRVLGTTAPASAAEWLQDLLAIPNSRFALQFGDADLSVQYAAGLDAPLTVDTLTPSIVAAGQPPATPDPTPTPGSEEEPPSAPGIDELTNIGDARADVFWPAGGTTNAALLTALGDEGATSSRTLVASDAVGGEAGPRARLGGAQLLVYDSRVSDALRTASSASLRAERSAALAEANAYATFTDPGTPLLVTVDRGPTRSGAALRIAITAALRLGDRGAVGLDAIDDVRPVTEVTAIDAEPDAARVAALGDLMSDEGELDRFATLLEDPTVLTAPERATILQLLGNGWLHNARGWSDAVAAHREATTTRLGAVIIVPSSDVTLLGSSAPLTFSVRNDLPWPVSLVLLTQQNDPRLIVDNTTAVTAGPLQTTRVEVPVESRVGSGQSSLTLQLRSPAMVPIGDPVTIVVTVEAEWESTGIAVMTVLVGVLLALGVVRTVVKLRRRRVPASGDDGESAGEAEAAATGEDAGEAAAEERADG